MAKLAFYLMSLKDNKYMITQYDAKERDNFQVFPVNSFIQFVDIFSMRKRFIYLRLIKANGIEKLLRFRISSKLNAFFEEEIYT